MCLSPGRASGSSSTVEFRPGVAPTKTYEKAPYIMLYHIIVYYV